MLEKQISLDLLLLPFTIQLFLVAQHVHHQRSVFPILASVVKAGLESTVTLLHVLKHAKMEVHAHTPIFANAPTLGEGLIVRKVTISTFTFPFLFFS